MPLFTYPQIEIVRFCAIECKMQCSGEESVAWMVTAWQHAMENNDRPPVLDDIVILGALVEPIENRRGYRRVGVRVGSDVKMPWNQVGDAMERLLVNGEELTPAAWFKEFEEIHPFIDGNGRTGQILFNWRSGTLDDPQWAPNFWHDTRRTKGYGA